MTSNLLSCHVLIDTLFVIQEVFHDLQAHQHRAIRHQLVLDFVISHCDGQRARLTVVFVVGGEATVTTSVGAHIHAVDVWDTLLRDSPLYHEVVYRGDKIATLATIVLIIAVNHFLRR